LHQVAAVLAQNGDFVAPDLTWWHWVAFGLFVIVLLVLDLAVFHRQTREPTLRESAVWTVVWCSIALAFNALIWKWRGGEAGLQFLTGYLIEWSLSMDNVFVFAVIFSFFRVPLRYQYRVLFWGIMGAIVMRLTFVLLGTTLLHYADWMLWIFGVFLIYTGVKLAIHDESEVDPQNNILMNIAKRFFPVAKGEYGERFFVLENGRWAITPLFLVLLVVESTDVLFAVDSVPAIFGVTKDPFIVFTSNIFAILGLRALYFLLAGVMDVFRYLNYGLSAVLIFVGVKMVVDYWAHDVIERIPHPQVVSLVVIATLLGTSILASIVAKRRDDAQMAARPGEPL